MCKSYKIYLLYIKIFGILLCTRPQVCEFDECLRSARIYNIITRNAIKLKFKRHPRYYSAGIIILFSRSGREYFVSYTIIGMYCIIIIRNNI